MYYSCGNLLKILYAILYIHMSHLSIIVPCFPPHIKYLNKLILNINNQTVLPEEIIVAISEMNNHDGNNLQTDLQENSNIKIIVFPTLNKCTAGMNRNRGVEKANHDYVMFLDADDLYHNQKIEITEKIINKYISQDPPNLIIHSFHWKTECCALDNIINLNDIKLIDSNKIYDDTFPTKIRNLSQETGNYGDTNLMTNFPIHHGVITVKRNVFEKIRYTSMPSGEDGRLCRDILWHLGNIVVCDAKLMIYQPIIIEKPQITVQLCGGLGNQLSQVSAVYAYIHEYKERTGKDIYPVIPKLSSSPSVIKDRPIYFDSLLNNLNYISPQEYSEDKWHKINEYEWTPNNFVISNSNNIKLEGYFQNPNYTKKIRDKLIEIFKFPDNINDDAVQYIQNIKNKYINRDTQHIQTSAIIAVHIRRGDYLQLSHFHIVLTTDYYKAALNKIHNKNNVYLFFSDDPNWCKSELIPELNELYDDFKYEIISGNNDITDLALMSKCDSYIIANSTFSWWGWYLNKNAMIDSVRVISPTRWFIGLNTNLLHSKFELIEN